MANDILERLRHRIDVFSKVEGKTEFGEVTYDYEKVSSVWVEIVPTTGKENAVKGDSIQVSVTHKITVRNGAIKEPHGHNFCLATKTTCGRPNSFGLSNDMYFIFKGQKYEVLYFMFHYRRNDLIEFYCKLIIETEEDYNGREESYT